MIEGRNKSLPVMSSRTFMVPQADWEELQLPRQPNSGWKMQRRRMTRGKKKTKKKKEKCSFDYFIPHLIISFPTLRDSLPWRGEREEQRSSILLNKLQLLNMWDHGSKKEGKRLKAGRNEVFYHKKMMG